MCQSPVCGNVSLHLCGKDTFTGVAKKHCGLDTYKCVIAQCADMCLPGYVADTFY